MILAPHILAAKAAIILAAAPAPGGMDCKVTEAPAISISVKTDDIVYDYSRSTATLTGVKTDTNSPYPKGTDSVTGGLREDTPEIKWETTWNAVYNPSSGIGCMSYKTINTNIHLMPKIFVAREFNTGPCREAVLTHERKHVQVDREVMNKYASLIGQALKQAVDKMPVFGPFNVRDENETMKMSRGYLKAVIDVQIANMEREMHMRQQQVDNLNEYRGISAVCSNLMKGVR
jgi:hypothetical protein